MYSRRSTRAARSGGGGGTTGASTKRSARKTRGALEQHKSSNHSTNNRGTYKQHNNGGPVRKWALVHRRPAPHIPFEVAKWVPVSELTVEELRQYEQVKMTIPQETINPEETLELQQIHQSIVKSPVKTASVVKEGKESDNNMTAAEDNIRSKVQQESTPQRNALHVSSSHNQDAMAMETHQKSSNIAAPYRIYHDAPESVQILNANPVIAMESAQTTSMTETPPTITITATLGSLKPATIDTISTIKTEKMAHQATVEATSCIANTETRTDGMESTSCTELPAEAPIAESSSNPISTESIALSNTEADSRFTPMDVSFEESPVTPILSTDPNTKVLLSKAVITVEGETPLMESTPTAVGETTTRTTSEWTLEGEPAAKKPRLQ